MSLQFIRSQRSNYLIWKELSNLGIRHCLTLRPDDYGFKTNPDKENLKQLYIQARSFAGCRSLKVIFPQQVHGSEVMPVYEDTMGTISLAGEYLPSCDALITNISGYTLVSQYADCIPISLIDRRQSVISCVHSGWRGTSQRILCHTIEKMNHLYGCNPEDIHCFIWPCIHQESFEVDADVAALFEAEFSQYPYEEFIYSKQLKYHIDLVYLNIQMAISQGISRENIRPSGLCTFTDKRFHSYRRDKTNSGRMALVMEL